jgi:hypothetical protein
MLWTAVAQLYRNQACSRLCLEGPYSSKACPLWASPYTYSYIQFRILPCEIHPIYGNKSYPLTTLHLMIDFTKLNGNVFY